MTDNDQHNTPTYRIGAVSRLTGVPADTLRVWERRYHVVVPIRTQAGTRLYGAEDLGRLSLIKRLVDRGDAISSVANLSFVQLRERSQGTDLPEPGPDRPCRVAVLGAALAGRLRLEAPALEGLEVVGLFERPDAFLAALAGEAPDLVLFDYPTVHPDQVREIGHLLAQSGASRAILTYHFASRLTLERLEARHILTRRAPLDAVELRRLCLALHQAQGNGNARQPEASVGLEVDLARPLPARRFGPEQLARIALASPTVRCECPHHLVDLISALAAFESYSEECEVRHADDAALHAYLHAATARARALLETALTKVVEAEGIEIGPC